jgi:hypothetical protein
MEKTLTTVFAKRVRAIALGTTLAVTSLGSAAFVFSEPAFAATVLSVDATSSLTASLTAAIQAAHGNPSAIEAAISDAVQNAIALYGADAAASITSAVMSISESAGATGEEIGVGLGNASASIAGTKPGAANAIAATLANEGKAGEISAFQTVTSSQGYSNLASIAGGSPGATGEFGGNSGGGLSGNSGSNFTGGGSGGSGGGCLNESCTSL